MKLPLNQKTELFRWGPIPGYFFFTSVFTEVNCKYFCQKYLGHNWSRTLFLFKEKRMLWLNEWPALRADGKKVFVKYVEPKSSRQKIYQIWKKEVEKLLNWHKYFDKINFAKLSNEELLGIWEKYCSDYIKFWIDGTVPELGNYGADKYFEDKLKKYFKNQNDLSKAIEILTAPLKPSFYQEEEMELSKTKDLVRHQQKYFWLKNSYAGTQITPVKFFVKRKKEIFKNIVTEVKKRISEASKQKKIFQKLYSLPNSLMNIAEAISDGIAWQDERKKYIFIVLHYQDKFLTEVARRFEYEKEDLCSLWFYEISEILKGEDFNSVLLKRRSGFGIDFHIGCKMLASKQTEYYWNLYSKEQVVGQKDIRGLIVSKGKIAITKGKVHILLDPTRVDKFKSGEILVAPMTSPEYIFAMKKAYAIITDAGGLTSHAAIVSRELGVPCIVGTKVATRIFKNGDMVELNTETGTVRIAE